MDIWEEITSIKCGHVNTQLNVENIFRACILFQYITRKQKHDFGSRNTFFLLQEKEEQTKKTENDVEKLVVMEKGGETVTLDELVKRMTEIETLTATMGWALENLFVRNQKNTKNNNNNNNDNVIFV